MHIYIYKDVYSIDKKYQIILPQKEKTPPPIHHVKEESPTVTISHHHDVTFGGTGDATIFVQLLGELLYQSDGR